MVFLHDDSSLSIKYFIKYEDNRIKAIFALIKHNNNLEFSFIYKLDSP